MPVNVNGFSVTLAGGVRETTQTVGTGTYSLDGAATVEGITYRTFVAGVGSGTITVYTVRLGAEFETCIGTVTSGAPATITRDSILESSNSDNAVNWGSGVKDIILDAPAAVFHSLQTDVSSRALATAALGSVKVTVRTTTGTFTRDAKSIGARVRIVGGGGAGGSANTTGAGEEAEGGGGGGGEYAEGYFTSAQIGASLTVTIGAGAGTAGGTGGTTSFGSLMTAIGGSGGTTGVDTTGNSNAGGGVGGSGGTGGYLRIPGEVGGWGIVRNGARNLTGWGGAAGGGLSVIARAVTGQTSGKNYGGGGSGGSHGQNTGLTSGAVGADGICIVEEFLST